MIKIVSISGNILCMGKNKEKNNVKFSVDVPVLLSLFFEGIIMIDVILREGISINNIYQLVYAFLCVLLVSFIVHCMNNTYYARKCIILVVNCALFSVNIKHISDDIEKNLNVTHKVEKTSDLESELELETMDEDQLNVTVEVTKTPENTNKLLSEKSIYNTVDEMMSDISLSDGDYVSTLGYYTKMDGGGANYLISESNNLEPDADTKYVYIMLSNGLYAVLLDNDLYKWVNVLQAGLPRNFGQADWDKIRPSNFAVTYFFPSGRYTITENISMGIEGDRDNGVGATLVGEAFNQSLDSGTTERRTVIDCSAISSGECFKWAGGAHVRDLVFVYNDGFEFIEDRRAYDTKHTAEKPFTVNMTDEDSGNGVTGVKADYDSVIENCTFYGFSGYGVYCTGLVRFINNKVVQCNTGIWTGTDSIITSNSFKACYTCMIVSSMTLVNDNRVDSCYYFAKVLGSLCVISQNNIDWSWLNGIYCIGNDNIITDNTGRFAICAFTNAETLQDRYAYRIESTGNKVSAILHECNITDGNDQSSSFVANCVYTTKSGNVIDIAFGGHDISSKSVMDSIIYTSESLTGAFRYNGVDYWMEEYSSVSDTDMSHIITDMS